MSRPVRVAVVLSTAAAAIAAMSLAAPTGNAASNPTKLLQAVHIDLGSGGDILGITRSDIAQDKSGYHAKQAELDPAAVAGKLPVRVSTFYAHDGHSGADLKDLRNVSGPINIGITVANQTLRPEKLTYSVDGRQVTTSGLVATPMTVVATAEIPKSAITAITTAQQRGLLGRQTNGTVATLPNGDYAVQWAAILAPPALSPTATFQLVLNATKFKLDGVSIDVEPGVTADPSLQTLVNEQFGNQSPLRGLENNTISVISDVESKLDSVRSQLSGIRGDLTEQVDDHGKQVVTDLHGSSAQIAQSIKQLQDEINALTTTLSGSFTSAGACQKLQLSAAVSAVLARLGSAQSMTVPTVDDNCRPAGQSTVPSAKTVYGQLDAIKAQLRDFGTTTAGQLQQDKVSLDSSINGILGSDDGGSATSADCTALTLTCLTANLGGLSGQLGTIDAALGAESDRLAALQTSLTTLGQNLGNVACRVDALQPSAAAAGTYSCPDGLTSAATTVADLKAQVRALVTLVDSGTSGLTSSDSVFGAIADVKKQVASAYDGLSAIADETGTGSDGAAAIAGAGQLDAQASKVDDAVCDLPSDYPDDPAASSYAKHLQDVAGLKCSSGSPSETASSGLQSLAKANHDAIDGLVSTVKAAQAALAPSDAASGPGDVLSALQGVSDSVGDITTAAKTLSDSVDTDATLTSVTSVGKEIASLAEALKDLGDPQAFIAALSAGTDSNCGKVQSSNTTTPLGVLSSYFFASRCARVDTAQDVSDAQAAAASATSRAPALANGIVGARAAADAQLGDTADPVNALDPGSSLGLIPRLQGKLLKAGNDEFREGTTQIRDVAAALVTNRNALNGRIDSTTKTLIADLQRQLAGAKKSQVASSKLLTEQVNAVLVALGTTRGSGILGGVYQSANSVGVNETDIGGASATGSSYRGVRQAQVAASDFAQQQQEKGYAAAAGFVPFDQSLPTGTAHSSVFVFDIASVR